MTLYELLGVGPSATSDELRRAYHAQALRYHPDRHRGNPLEALAHERLAELNRAYEVLSNPDRRTTYDATLEPKRQPSARNGPTGLLVALACVVLLPRLGALVIRLLVGIVRGALQLLAMRGTLAVLVIAAFVGAIPLVRSHRRRRHAPTARGP